MMRYAGRFFWLPAMGAVLMMAAGAAFVRAQDASMPPLIPQPVAMQIGQGDYRLPEVLTIHADEASREIRDVFIEQIRNDLGLDAQAADQTAAVRIAIDSSANLGAEGYRLTIDNQGVTIVGNDPAGALYGTQTLRQLLHHRGDAPNLRQMTISDQPRFGWRGVMLDPARYFIPVEKVKQVIDLLALHKMNRLHLHLTDDQGWRIQIRKYPELTDATRWPASARNRNDPGFYTQEEIRELVAYATARQVLLIPEIDVPAHSTVSAYVLPQLLCRNNPHPGSHEWTEFCAGRDEPVEIFADIIAEVAELFPGPYIHIGGDEYWGLAWAQCPDCQKRLADANLESGDTEELRTLYAKSAGDKRRYLLYRDLMRRMAAKVTALGRTPIMWDDISWRGAYPEGAVVMQWHYKGGMDFWAKTQVLENPAAHAAEHGHASVVVPFSHLYLDLPKSLKTIYEFEPMPAELSGDRQQHLLGAQGCNWECPLDRIDQRLFPRVSIIAEMAWSPKANRRWDAFRPRLAEHLKVLDRLGVQYIPDADLGGTTVGQWSPQGISEQMTTLGIDLTAHVSGPGEYLVIPQYQRGNHGVEIESVTLLRDGVEVSRDAHTGTSGWQHVNNLYRLALHHHEPGASYRLEVRLKSSGGTDSTGRVVLFARPR